MTEILEEANPEASKQRRLDRIRETYGDVADPAALLSEAEAADINADALFQQGFPDRAEAEGQRAQRLETDGKFLLDQAGVDSEQAPEAPEK